MKFGNVKTFTPYRNPILEAPSFTVVDVETGSFESDSVISIAAVRVDNDRITARVSTLVNFEGEIMSGAQKVHGITREMLQGAPNFHAAFMLRVLPLIVGSDALVAWNAPFDRRMCDGSLKVRTETFCPPWECAMLLAKRVWKGRKSYKLEEVARGFGLSHKPHDALSDAEVTAQLVVMARRQSKGAA